MTLPRSGFLTSGSGAGGSSSGDVSASSNLDDNTVLRGDGGLKGIQDSGVVIDDSDNVTGVTTLTLPNTGLHLLDTNASHDLIIAPGSDLTADHTLTVVTGDADRTLTLSGAATISGTNTGDVTLAGTPDYITIAGQVITRAKLDPVDDLNTFASSVLAGLLTDETGTDKVVFNTDPVFASTITVPNTGLHILDTNASHDLIIKPGSDLTDDHTLTVTTGDADRSFTITGTASIVGTNTGDQTLSGLGGIGGSTGAVDNAIIRADGVGGATVQALSLVTISDAGAIATTQGVNLSLAATAPTAANGASQSGKTAALTASAAVASLDTNGAAAGGAVTITAGAAARLVSGNANGGDINLLPGPGIGIGTTGFVYAGSSNAGANLFCGTLHLNDASSSYTRIQSDASTSGIKFFASNSGTNPAYLKASDVYVFDASSSNQTAAVYTSGNLIAISSDWQLSWSSSATDWNSSKDTGLARNAAGVVRVTNASTGLGSLLAGVLVEANTAGSGSPNILVANESRSVMTNEGASAKNYHTLPTAVAGYVFYFVVQDADGLRVTANTGDTIRIAGTVSASAGYAESTTIGDTLTLVSINATEWFALNYIGTWTVT